MANIGDTRYNSRGQYEVFQKTNNGGTAWVVSTEPKVGSYRKINGGYQQYVAGTGGQPGHYENIKTTNVGTSKIGTDMIETTLGDGKRRWIPATDKNIKNSVKERELMDKNLEALGGDLNNAKGIYTMADGRQYVITQPNSRPTQYIPLTPQSLSNAIAAGTVTKGEADGTTGVSYGSMTNKKDQKVYDSVIKEVNTNLNNDVTNNGGGNETPSNNTGGTNTNGGGTTSKGGGTSKGGSKGVWNANAVKQPEPTYVDPNGITHTGMTQEEFDNSMRMYEIDNQGWYNKQRSRTIGDTGKTADDLFKGAIDKLNANPDAFSDDQKKVLLNAGIQLGYYNRDGSPRNDIEIPEENTQISNPSELTRNISNPSITTSNLSTNNTRTNNQGSTHVGYGGSGGEGYATSNDRRMQGGSNSMFWSL